MHYCLSINWLQELFSIFIKYKTTATSNKLSNLVKSSNPDDGQIESTRRIKLLTLHEDNLVLYPLRLKDAREKKDTA